jgi:hypothetical protein
MERNSSLWLHLAEFCILATKKSHSHEVKHLYRKGPGDRSAGESPKLVASTVLAGSKRKIFVQAPIL